MMELLPFTGLTVLINRSVYTVGSFSALASARRIRFPDALPLLLIRNDDGLAYLDALDPSGRLRPEWNRIFGNFSRMQRTSWCRLHPAHFHLDQDFPSSQNSNWFYLLSYLKKSPWHKIKNVQKSYYERLWPWHPPILSLSGKVGE